MFSGVALVFGTGAVALASAGGISFTTAPATAQLVLSRAGEESTSSTSSTSSSTSSSVLGANTRTPSMATSPTHDDDSNTTGVDPDDSTTSTRPKTGSVLPQSSTTPTCTDDDSA